METKTTMNSIIAWLGFIIAIAALILAVMAYDKTGANVNENLKTNYDQTINQLSVKTARLQALAQLSLLEIRQSASQNYTEFEQEITSIQQDLQEAYRNASLETGEEWQSINQQLKDLLAEIKVKAATSRASLRSLIERLGQS
jgi:thymidylate kinase